MFDMLGWKFEYEPSEVNGRNPDFNILCNSRDYPTKVIVVEVKPSVMVDEDYLRQTYEKYDSLKAHILVITDMPFTPMGGFSDCISIGMGSQYWGRCTDHERRSYMYGLEMKETDGKFDIGSTMLLWDGMINGKVERKHFVREGEKECWKLQQMWAEAGNRVMFEVSKGGANG